jgi:hypothetical protein
MRKLLLLIFLLLIINGSIFSQTLNGIFRTSFVMQIWSIETINDPISESTLPLEVIYPVRENLTLQFNHSPAASRFGGINMSGLSDTWIRTTYGFKNNRTLVSVGLGIPTGKTELNSSELILSSLLSQNAFKFRVPVFGQGLTLSTGVMYAYPVNETIIIGTGINYVLRGKYKYIDLQTNEYDPGDQIGANFGFDYLIFPNLRSNFDLIISYYTADKFNNMEMFKSGAKFSTKLAMQYQLTSGYLWMRAYYSAKGKNEAWNDQALVLQPQDKNYNIKLRELEIGAKLGLLETLSIFLSGEIRSYVGNDIKQGWVDIFGAGVGYELQMSKRFSFSMGAKFYLGEGAFMNITPIPTCSGFELQLGTQWKF